MPGTHTEDTKRSLLLLNKEKKKKGQNYHVEIPRATLPSVRKKWSQQTLLRGLWLQSGEGLAGCLKLSDSSGVHTLAPRAMTID